MQKHTNRERFFGFLAQTSDSPLAIEIQKAEGVYLYANGKTYIDCISGISVSNLGHSNAAINEALKNHAYVNFDFSSIEGFTKLLKED